MPRHEKYVPTHRDAPSEPALKKGVRKSILFSGIAVAATGIAVSSGIVTGSSPADAAASALTSAHAALTSAQAEPVTATLSDPLSDRGNQTSRSDRRTSLATAKEQALNQDSGGQVTRTEDLSSQDPRDVARAMLPQFGFSDSEFGCLDSLYISESGWNPNADNASSSAYGIPQALTASTSNLPSDYTTNPVSQIRWGLGYIRSSYGTPCSAWSFKQSNGWY